MSAQPVQWILVVFFGMSAHRATYGRLSNEPKYSKDYIQLSRKPEFLADLAAAFPALATGAQSVPLTYKWPSGSTQGTLFTRSADRPHLAWETNKPPAPWKMIQVPTQSTVETIPGTPGFTSATQADNEYDQLSSQSVGQPYLIAVKLFDDENSLHLRVHIDNPSQNYRWADLSIAPATVRSLAASTSKNSALAWQLFNGPLDPATIHFDPDEKANPWNATGSISKSLRKSGKSDNATPQPIDRDALAEELEHSEEEVKEFEDSIEAGNFEVPDKEGTSKTRGSAQRAFSKKVKDNYGWQCALTGIRSKEFLIASHIVPWSVDKTIRIDPSNGICLSVLVDRAFEHGFLSIDDDLTVHVVLDKIEEDAALKDLLAEYDGAALSKPTKQAPKTEYLKRRREL